MSTPALEETRRRYERAGLLAMEPRAFFELFLPPTAAPANATVGSAEVVDIRGPLNQHGGSLWCDSYEAIALRMRAACEGPSPAIVLRIDSPGGEAAGCLETARQLRAMAAKTGKPLHAFVEGRACSAAYALACAASKITAAETAIVGSVGIIETRCDMSAADTRDGYRYAVIASGTRKADGHLHVPLTDDELKASQVVVDSIAAAFYELVADMRRLSVEAVAGLQAGVFHGKAAIDARLVDVVQSFEAMIASISIAGGKPMTKYEEARKALEEAAEGEGDEAALAKKALAAIDEPESPPPKKDDEGESDEDDEGAESDEDEPEAEAEEGDDESAKASARGARVEAKTAAELAAAVSLQGKRLARLERAGEDTARTSLLASRPDLDKALVKVLRGKPLADVKAIVDAIPKPKIPSPAAAAQAGVTPIRGEGQGTPGPTAQSAEIDLRMGLTPHKLGVARAGNKLTFGVQVAPPVEAKK